MDRRAATSRSHPLFMRSDARSSLSLSRTRAKESWKWKSSDFASRQIYRVARLSSATSPRGLGVYAVSTMPRSRHLATYIVDLRARTHAYLFRARARECTCAYVLLGVAKLSTLSTRNRSLHVRLPVDELAAKERLSIPRLLDTCQDIRFVNRGAKRPLDDQHCVLCRKDGREKERSSLDCMREMLTRWFETIFASASVLCDLMRRFCDKEKNYVF